MDKPVFFSLDSPIFNRAHEGPRLNSEFGGWIVTGRRSLGRALPRQFLVAAESKEEALVIARGYLCDARELEIVGAAHAIHFRRRNMKPGDLCELGGNGRIYTGSAPSRQTAGGAPPSPRQVTPFIDPLNDS